MNIHTNCAWTRRFSYSWVKHSVKLVKLSRELACASPTTTNSWILVCTTNNSFFVLCEPSYIPIFLLFHWYLFYFPFSLVSRHRPVMKLGLARPAISKTSFIAPNAAVVGNVTLAENTSVWYGSVVRGISSFSRLKA